MNSPNNLVAPLSEIELLEPETKPEDEEQKFMVHVPDRLNITGPWFLLADFPTWAEALHYAQETLGADDQGKIQVITPVTISKLF